MRVCLQISVVAVLTAFASSAWAASSPCTSGPPKWWNAPRVSYTTTQSWGEGYGRRGPTHEYSAQRRSPAHAPQRYRDSSRRW